MPEKTILQTCLEWMPFIFSGFLLNVLMSVLAIALGTIGGTLMGLGQISHNKAVAVPSRLATQLFRNAPWLVLLFYCIFLLPYKITVFGAEINLPSWLRATIGFSFPVAANFAPI